MVSSQKLEQYRGADRATLVGPFFSGQAKSWPEPVLFVDGGVRFRQGNEGVSVGDGDSAGHALEIPLPREKDYSDFAYALSLLPETILTVDALGFLGGRLDHQLCNLGEAQVFLKSGEGRSLHFDQQVRGYSPGSWDLDIHGLFSVLVLEKGSLLIHGECAYQTREPRDFPVMGSLGLSNEGRGRVGIHATQPFFVFQS